MKIEQLIDDILFRIGDPKDGLYPRESIRRTLNRIYQQLNLQLRVLQNETVFDPTVNPLTLTQIMVIGTDVDLSNPATDRHVTVTMDGVAIISNAYTGASSADDFALDLKTVMDLISYVDFSQAVLGGVYNSTMEFNDYPYVTHTLEFEETINDALPGSLIDLISHQPYYIGDAFTLPSDWHMPYRMKPLYNFIYPEPYKDSDYLRDVFTIENNLIHFAGAEVEGFEEVTVGYWSLGKELVEKVSDATTQVNEPEWRKDLHDILFYGGAIETSGEYTQFQMDMVSFQQRKVDLSRSVKVLSDVNPQITPWNNQAEGYNFGYGRTGQRYVGPKPYYNDQDK